jgi:hypothetical protein
MSLASMVTWKRPIEPRCTEPTSAALPEGRERVDRDDVHAEPPLQRPGEEPVADALAVPPIDEPPQLWRPHG